MMNLQYYLVHRRKIELLSVLGILAVIVVVNSTTLGIEYMRTGTGMNWTEAWATETTSVVAAGLLIPVLFNLLNKLDLGLHNISQRGLWLIPLFVGYSILHIGLFVVFRKLLWAASGSHYTFQSLPLALIYEMRKDLLGYAVTIAVFYSYRFIINRLQGEAHFLDQNPDVTPDQFRSQFLVKMLDKEFLVKVEDIDWIQSASNYVVLHCGERHFPMRQTLKQMSNELDPKLFQRVHRTAIVNLDSIRKLRERGETEVELKSGATVTVSKTYLTPLQSALILHDKSLSAE